jgi:hypothetical protein
MYGGCLKLTKDYNYTEHIVGTSILDSVFYKFKEGTKVTSFKPKEHLFVGVEVHASKFGGKTCGKITQIIDKDYCRIDGELTFISDITKIKLN